MRIKQTYPSIASKCSVIIRTLSPSVVCLTATPQKKLPDSPKSKYKTKAVSYITEVAINTPR